MSCTRLSVPFTTRCFFKAVWNIIIHPMQHRDHSRVAVSIFQAALTGRFFILDIIYQIAREMMDKTDSHDEKYHQNYHFSYLT